MKGAPLAATEPELIALSAGVTDFEHPYWLAGRIDAGTEKALAEAVAIEPETPKLPLFRAALAARHDAFAVAVAQQMMPFFFEDGGFTPWVADQFLSGMPVADRVEIARGMAGAHQRLGDVRAAALLDEIAQKLSPDAAAGRALAALKARMELDAKNAGRRPVVTNNLEQDRLVRARLSR
jgi:hypothetical protein